MIGLLLKVFKVTVAVYLLIAGMGKVLNLHSFEKASAPVFKSPALRKFVVFFVPLCEFSIGLALIISDLRVIYASAALLFLGFGLFIWFLLTKRKGQKCNCLGVFGRMAFQAPFTSVQIWELR